MIACYDLARNPPTYDVVAFLALLEIERLRRGEEHIDLHILPGDVGGFRRDSLWPRSIEERVALRENVLVPLCQLLPSVRTVTVQETRPAELRGAFGYGTHDISLPAIVKALKQGSRPLRPYEPCSTNLKDITFTLREAEHHPFRNSKVDEWKKAYEVLEGRGWNVSFIRDTCKWQDGKWKDEWGCYKTNPFAAVGLYERSMAYDAAVLNVGVSNGPMWMAIFMDVPTLMLRPTTEAGTGCFNNAFFRRWGVEPGTQLPTSPPYQRLAWVDDTCENIVNEVEGMFCETG